MSSIYIKEYIVFHALINFIKKQDFYELQPMSTTRMLIRNGVKMQEGKKGKMFFNILSLRINLSWDLIENWTQSFRNHSAYVKTKIFSGLYKLKLYTLPI